MTTKRWGNLFLMAALAGLSAGGCTADVVDAAAVGDSDGSKVAEEVGTSQSAFSLSGGSSNVGGFGLRTGFRHCDDSWIGCTCEDKWECEFLAIFCTNPGDVMRCNADKSECTCVNINVSLQLGHW
jgi:hypothetical protein